MKLVLSFASHAKLTTFETEQPASKRPSDSSPYASLTRSQPSPQTTHHCSARPSQDATAILAMPPENLATKPTLEKYLLTI
ncbi:hypothetical protein CY34DRAFT_807673 [Suillus luteus UH-Slu-Lm8-n1]|uniref:Uncharacterized protein n=1 Tax=Suillus luteus UH-Slu-Lm8-n1 TaxID=930992 RepID=A0A0D0APV5_9AGAM|nr:hypothetical protein CY34DRAFT_807673 [Suillus luteus UH-Slu-Lm8-n1]